MNKQILIVLILLPLLAAAQPAEKPNVWEPLEFLVGVWTGTGQGGSGISPVIRSTG